MPHPSETRQKVLQLCQLDLQSALPTTRALSKNVEDQLCSIEDLAREEIFQVATLSRREFVIKNNRGHVLILTRILDGLRFVCVTVSTTFAPAELASSRSSSSESCKSHFETPSFSKPIRSARSCVFCGRVSIIPFTRTGNPSGAPNAVGAESLLRYE